MDLIMRMPGVVGSERASGRHRHRGRQDRRDRSRSSRPRARLDSAAGWSRRVSSRPTSISTSRASSGRCKAEKGDLEEAIGEVATRRSVHAEDVYSARQATSKRRILHGTTHMRTQVEVDPGIGLRGLEGVRR